ncbi:hypothetical protein HPB50_006959 [Hyalomma asiaticum]|uniref:Uncharacterized protein n=1 Tax=Hyalomma asiaticum TaxID=266040 RepID=A0ACB7TDL6_HYAAI|nr:hypothetical protein HPB50_006959 [Hyalomma asiaticum]
MVVSGSEDDAESPPSVLTGGIAESSSDTDDSGAPAGGRAVVVSKGREATGASLHSVQEEEVDRGSTSSDAERASSFLTKADVIRKRRERIEKRQKLLEEFSYSHRRSSDESSRSKRSFRQASVIMPKFKRISGRYTPAPKTVSTPAARATSSTKSGSDNEDPLAGLEKGQFPPSFCLSSAASSFADAPEGSASTHVRMWHSTPHSTPKKAISLSDIRVAHAPPPRGMTVAKGASASSPQRSGRRREVLERGEVLILTKSPEQEFAVAGRSFRDAPLPMKPPSAAPGRVPQAAASISGPSGRHDESSISEKSVDAAERSTLIRIGIGDNHERVLSSNASSVSSALVSFSAAKKRSRTSPAGHQLHSDQCQSFAFITQAKEAPAADVDVQSVDLLKQLLNMCEQEAPVTFEFALKLAEHDLKCHKLGEGCTADVYLLRRPSGEEIAVKVIPVGSERLLNGEMPMSLASVIAEAVMTRELSNLRFGQLNRTPTFIELKKVYCVQGAYDPVLVKSWNEYDLVWCSENCDPLLFEENQLFALLVFENGGKTLERFKGTIEQIESVLLQVACSLAAAEPELEFEHRDLHTDNVLVKSTEQDCIEFVLNGRKVLVRTAGVQASIIDYTFSRLRKGDNVVYTDPSGDTELFKGSGSRQFDIYRIMRDENGNDWEAYHPHSNVVWLHYLLQKLLDRLPTTKPAVKAKYRSTGRSRMVAWADAILALQSVEEFAAQHVLPHLERDAEAHHKRRRSSGLQTRKPHYRKVRAWR